MTRREFTVLSVLFVASMTVVFLFAWWNRDMLGMYFDGAVAVGWLWFFHFARALRSKDKRAVEPITHERID